MKIQYLGTAAAEGIPAIFCTCDFCQKAKKAGGKNIRTRPQAIIDDKILIDLPADTYMHGIVYNIDFSKIATVIITHSHQDHLYPDEFAFRNKGFSNLEKAVTMTIYGSEDIEEPLKPYVRSEEPYGIKYCKILPFEPFEVEDGYWITALKANHTTEHPYIYLIEHEGQSMLYAHDTGTLLEESYKYLLEKGVCLDMLSLDCTEGTHPMNYDTHMNVEKCILLTENMRRDGLVKENAVVCLNHFSHNGMEYLHEDMEKLVEKHQLLMSYDGMIIEL